jgi:hypothetical protein
LAHSCPECGYTCHCGGDIDDCIIEGTREEARCQHCPDELFGDDDDSDEIEFEDDPEVNG